MFLAMKIESTKIILQQHFSHPKDARNVENNRFFKNMTQVDPLKTLMTNLYNVFIN